MTDHIDPENKNKSNPVDPPSLEKQQQLEYQRQSYGASLAFSLQANEPDHKIIAKPPDSAELLAQRKHDNEEFVKMGFSSADDLLDTAKGAGDQVGAEFIAKLPDRNTETLKLSGQEVIVNGRTITDAASVEIAEPSKYAPTSRPSGPKCNLFVYGTYHRAGLSLPTDSNGQPLTCHGLNIALEHDPRFEKTWARDNNENQWMANKTYFMKNVMPKNGDIAIWDNKYLQHSGVLEETTIHNGNIYYAGRETTSGTNYTDLWYFLNGQREGYGAPDAIYHLKHSSG